MSVAPGTSSREEPATARAEEIRSIAARLFESKGYSATTMADIAETAGVLPGSLYHHVDSKETLAVDLLEALEADLNTLAERLMVDDAGRPPAVRLQHLVAQVMVLSYRHAAAVRLRAYEPPTVASDRLREALYLSADPLDRLWRAAIAELGEAPSGDAGLLRFALQSIAINAAANHPRSADPELLAARLCELMLHGVATGVDDRELDGSTALSSARAAVASWGPRPGPTALDEQRERILAAARHEFARRGYDATTVRDIAASAGVTMSSLYRRTPSKDALLAEVLGAYSAHFDRAARGALTTGSPHPAPLDALIWVFVCAARRFEEESSIVKVGWVHRTVAVDPLAEYFRATDERLALLQASMRQGARDGTLRPLVVDQDVATLIRFVMWLPYQDEEATSAERAHRFLRRCILRGYLNGSSA